MSLINIQGIKDTVRFTLHGSKNVFLRAINKPLKPKWLWFEVTDLCNSRCKHCNIWKKKPTRNPLTAPEIENVLSDPLFNEVTYIINSGGEPTLRSDIKEIILAEHRALPKAIIQLSTNGLLPERVIGVVRFAVKHSINISVGVSLDGVGEKHDLIRGVKGNFEKVDWLLHELIKLRGEYSTRLDVCIGFTLSDLTLPLFKDVKAYAQKLGVKILVQCYDESTFYSNIGARLASKSSDFIRILHALPPSPYYDFWLRSLRKGKPIKFQCFAMYSFCALRCNGDIVPCLRLFDEKVGNVRERSPTDIWKSQRAMEVRNIVKNCRGCLNSWGVTWSFDTSYYPILRFLLLHPSVLLSKLRKRTIQK